MSASGSNNHPTGRTTEELTEIAVRHLLRDTEHWGYVTEAEARAAIERMRTHDLRYGPEIARRRVWDEPIDVPAPREPIDLTEPAAVAP